MAKEQRSQSTEEVEQLASRLFEKYWQPRGQTEDAALAAMCFRGARGFLAVASQIREGRTPEQVLAADEQTLSPVEKKSIAA